MDKGCFPFGTKVLAASGLKRIEDVKVGQLVASYNANRGEVEMKPVERVRHFEHVSIWDISFESGEKLSTTRYHSFFDGSSYRRCSALRPGDRILAVGSSGEYFEQQISSVGRTCEVGRVANLYVEGNYTFIAGGVVSHSFSHARSARVWLHTLKGKFIQGMRQPVRI